MVAIKVLKLDKIVSSDSLILSIKNEISMHWVLSQCEAILKLQEIYIDHSYVYLVLEY